MRLTVKAVLEPGSEAMPQINKPSKEFLDNWVQALISDDEITARGILESADKDLQLYLLNGDYVKECAEQEARCRDKSLRIPGFRITRPFTLIIAFGAFRVSQMFLEYGVDACQRDWMMNNAIHALVYLCYLDPSRESQFVDTYKKLCVLLEVQVLKGLLLTENGANKRPLELAAHVGAFEMLLAIFDTRGVYLVKTEVLRTFYKLHWYDITEYESCYPNNRSRNSPLLYLTFIDDSRLKSATDSKIYVSDPFNDWMKKKSEVFRPWVCLWIAVRAFYLFMFLFYHFTAGPLNISDDISTSPLPNNGSVPCDYHIHRISYGARFFCMTYLLVHSLVLVLADIAEWTLICMCRGVKSVSMLPRGRKQYVVSVKVYKFMQFTLMACMTASMIIDITKTVNPDVNISPLLQHMLYGIECLTITWSLLYFLQLIPFMGYFVINIQRMVKDLLRFTILFVVCLIPFALAFQQVARDSKYCSVQFRNFPITVYTTFTLMLNMVDFWSYDNSLDNSDFAAMLMLHMFFVFIVAILLLNFLIALFSNTISYTTENCDAIIAIQQYSIFWMLEFRLAYWLQNRFYRRRVEDKFYSQDGRLYVTRLQVRCGQPLQPRLIVNREHSA